MFIKGFDDQLYGVKKKDTKKVEVTLPENFPEKDFANKKAIFECTISNIKINHEVKVDDDFAKNLGAKDLNGLKELISKQINDEYKNSLDTLTKNQILDQIDKIKIDAIPQDLIDQEIKVLTYGMKEEEINKKKKEFEDKAKKRIKTGLILNEYGQKNKINVTEQELNMEIQKQFQMMPGQEKMVKDYYEKNPSAIASLRGSIYEEKIINEIKKQAKANIKEISKEEAEKILKSENEKAIKQTVGKVNKEKKDQKKDTKPAPKQKKITTSKKTRPSKSKKVSKK